MQTLGGFSSLRGRRRQRQQQLVCDADIQSKLIDGLSRSARLMPTLIRFDAAYVTMFKVRMA